MPVYDFKTSSDRAADFRAALIMAATWLLVVLGIIGMWHITG